MNKAGRPSKYDPDRHPIWAQGLAKIGKTEKQIASSFGVNIDTITDWKKKYPEFSVSIRIGKEEADSHVVNALYKRSIGYETTEKKVIQLPDTSCRIEITTKEVLPEPNCIRFWLTNRQSNDWRNNVHQEVTGKDGEPIVMMARDMTDDEIEKRARAIFERRT